MNKVILIRGLPGSGKSTYYKNYFSDTHVLVEADMFFIKSDGTYLFEPHKLRDAHAWCFETFRSHVENDQPVVVANTFTQLWEIQPYLDVAPYAFIFRMMGQHGNIHGVPLETIERMKHRFENIENERRIEDD